MDIQVTTIDTITVNDIMELSQDSYYTRNPEDFGVEGDMAHGVQQLYSLAL